MDLSGHQADISIPMTTTYIPPHANHTHGHTIMHQTQSSSNNNNNNNNINNSNGPTMTRTNIAVEDPNSPRREATQTVTPFPVSKKPLTMVKYRECLKNHAASIGGNATDGCGEFMPSGTDGTIEALKCSACGCHRNFHRKEVEGDPFGSSCHCKGTPYLYSPAGRNSLTVRPSLPALTHHAHHQLVMPLSAMQTSESDEMEGVGGTMMGSTPPMMTGHHHQNGPLMTGKKRYRTKFTPDQKEKMLGFAERVGWRLQRLEDGVVQQFCQEIGVKRRVLKVWMHNNKHSLAKKLGGPDDEQELHPHPHPQLQLD